MSTSTNAVPALSVTLHFTRSTKNTHRYDEAGERDQHVIGCAYIPKRIFPFPPSSIQVTVQSVPAPEAAPHV